MIPTQPGTCRHRPLGLKASNNFNGSHMCTCLNTMTGASAATKCQWVQRSASYTVARRFPDKSGALDSSSFSPPPPSFVLQTLERLPVHSFHLMFLSFSILCLLVALPLGVSSLAVDPGPESTEDATATATDTGDDLFGRSPIFDITPGAIEVLTYLATFGASETTVIQTNVVTLTLESTIQNDELCTVALNCTTSSSSPPTSSVDFPSSTTPPPSSPASTEASSTSSSRSSTPSATGVIAAASSENDQAIRQRKYLIGGIIGGLLMLGTLGVMLFIIIRRRRLRKHLRDSKFLADPEMASPSPSESRGLVMPSPTPSPSGARDINMDQKAIVRRAELEGQVQIVENEMAELQRRITVQFPPVPGSDSPGENRVDSGDQHLNSLRARVRELERQRDIMRRGDAPPGYRQFDAVE
ncbi:hypothetical protein B0H11DRAFT_1956329 [Mycena galericulata]|nr:hypothetical protein B0H11DRAFT_1956329 [Mycena galericulata]